jgi:hypothetical protein
MEDRAGMSDKTERKLPADFWYHFMTMAHHVIVIVDDFLCDELGLSRKPKGKYADPSYPDKFTDKQR